MITDLKHLFAAFFSLTLTYLEVKGQTKVIVVGGGLSGVTIARDLLNAEYDVTVLEARSRPGGRIWSYDLIDSSVDLGSAFIYPKEVEVLNKTVELKLSLGNITMLNCAVRDEAKNLIETPTFVEDVLLAMVNLQKVHDAYNYTWSILEALRVSRVDQELANRGGPAWTVGRHIMEFLMGGGFEQMSIKVRIPSDELQKVIFVIKDGMQSFIESLILGKPGEQEVNLMYNSEVTKIEKTDNGFEVTSNGNIMTAKHVVVAVPAAVLKAQRIQFEPQLSNSRLRALRHVGVGITNKLVLEFDSIFWDTSSVHFVGYLPGENEDTSSLIYWMNYHHVLKKPVLVGFLTGRESVNSENMTAEEVRDKGLAVLRKMFGDVTVNSRTVVTYHNTKWGTEPFSLGSHVFRTPEMGAGDFQELSKSEDNLHFIGDYTNLQIKGLGTITGAYYSAKRVHEHILEIDKFVTPSTAGPSTATTTVTKFTSPTTTFSSSTTDGSTGDKENGGNINYTNNVLLLSLFTMSLLPFL